MTTAISSLAGSSTTAAAGTGFSDLSSEEFVQIILTELTKQDPLKPSDTSALLEQLSTIRSIESDLDLQQQLESVVTQNQLATAGSLLGKQISGFTADFRRVTGEVQSVTRGADGPILNLVGGSRVPFSNVDQFFNPPAAGSSN